MVYFYLYNENFKRLQHEKMNTIYYTLRVYSTTEFRLHKVKVPYTVKKKV